MPIATVLRRRTIIARDIITFGVCEASVPHSCTYCTYMSATEITFRRNPPTLPRFYQNSRLLQLVISLTYYPNPEMNLYNTCSSSMNEIFCQKPNYDPFSSPCHVIYSSVLRVLRSQQSSHASQYRALSDISLRLWSNQCNRC